MRGESIAIPVSTDDPAGAMATFHGLLKELRKEAQLPAATALDGVINVLGPAVGPLFGTMLTHDDIAMSNIPAGDQAIYLAGAKIVGLYPLAPSWAQGPTARTWVTTTWHSSGSTPMRQQCRIWTCSPVYPGRIRRRHRTR